jgi:hypothetical protein
MDVVLTVFAVLCVFWFAWFCHNAAREVALPPIRVEDTRDLGRKLRNLEP